MIMILIGFLIGYVGMWLLHMNAKEDRKDIAELHRKISLVEDSLLDNREEEDGA